MHITLAFVHGYLGERLSLSLSPSNQTSLSLSHKSDVSVRMTAVLHAHTLTDDGMHLVLQTGSTAYM
jgi:hypothetical protein